MASRLAEAHAAILAVADAGDRRELRFSGRLDAYSIATVWHDALAALAAAPERAIVIDASGVDYCDGAGIAMLIDLLRQPRAANAPISISGLRPEFQALLDQFDPAAMQVPVESHVTRINVVAEIGRAAAITGRDIRDQRLASVALEPGEHVGYAGGRHQSWSSSFRFSR